MRFSVNKPCYCRDLSDDRLVVLTYHDVSALGSVHGHQRSTIDSRQLRRHKGRPGGKGNSGSAKGCNEKGKEGLHDDSYISISSRKMCVNCHRSINHGPSKEKKIQGSAFSVRQTSHTRAR